jgi:hypothetical protein
MISLLAIYSLLCSPSASGNILTVEVIYDQPRGQTGELAAIM